MTEGISIANRNFLSQRLYSFHAFNVELDTAATIGASGAPTILTQYGVQSITRLSAGRYRVQLQDNYSKLLDFSVKFASPVTGSSVPDGSFSVGTVYQITAVGNTDWASAGLPAGITAAVGDTFKAATVGGSGTGTAKAIGNSGIVVCEAMSNTTQMLNNQPFQALSGGYFDFQCLAATNSSTTTLIPTDPASGSTMYITVRVSNSSIQ